MVLAPYLVRKKYGFHFWDLGILEWGFQDFASNLWGFSQDFSRFPQDFTENVCRNVFPIFFVEVSAGIFLWGFSGASCTCCEKLVSKHVFHSLESVCILGGLAFGHCWGKVLPNKMHFSRILPVYKPSSLVGFGELWGDLMMLALAL